MVSTTVVKLATGEEAVFDLPPREAVIAAYRQLTRKDFNTWQEPRYLLPIHEGEVSVSCGDWCALKPAWYEPLPAPGDREMVANVYRDGKHTRLRVTVFDLEELIVRCGWTVVHQIENLTPAAMREIRRLEAKECVEQNGSGTEWWKERVISEASALTPDMD